MSLVSRIFQPSLGTRLFSRGDYSTALFNVLDGEVHLFAEGDAVDRLYLLRSGSMSLSRTVGERDLIVSYCAAGSFVDVVGCQSGVLSRTVTARATVASEALSIDYVSFCDLQAEYPRL